jgi:hypothetical protein
MCMDSSVEDSLYSIVRSARHARGPPKKREEVVDESNPHLHSTRLTILLVVSCCGRAHQARKFRSRNRFSQVFLTCRFCTSGYGGSPGKKSTACARMPAIYSSIKLEEFQYISYVKYRRKKDRFIRAIVALTFSCITPASNSQMRQGGC